MPPKVHHTPKAEPIISTEKVDSKACLMHQRTKIQNRVSTISRTLEEANNDPTIVEVTPSDEIEDEDEALDIFDALHTDTLSLIEHLVENLSPAAVRDISSSATIQQQSLRAPVPTFDGKVENWPKFRTMFEDIIGRSCNSDAVKLHHLDKALIDDASGLITAKMIVDNNFQQTWKQLSDQFENPRVIVDTHLEGLLEMKPMTKRNHKDLLELLKTFNRHVGGLEYQGLVVDELSGLILTKILTTRLDEQTLQLWKRIQQHAKLPKYEETALFLRNECQVLERFQNRHQITTREAVPKQQSSSRTLNQKSHAVTTVTGVSSCQVCGGNHRHFECPEFNKLSTTQRIEKVKELNICFNCLRLGHRSLDCSSKKSCYRCHKRHHTLLHEESVFKEAPPSSQTPDPMYKTGKDSLKYPQTVVACSNSNSVMLMTAVVLIKDQYRLKFEKQAVYVPIAGIGEAKACAKEKLVVKVESRLSDFTTCIECLVVPKITGPIPSAKIDISSWPIDVNLPMADPKFNIPSDIDMLIGASQFLRLLKTGRMQLKNNLPELQETHFGWVVAGDFDGAITSQQCLVSTTDSISDILRQFWELEEIAESATLSFEQDECEKIFQSSHTRDVTGRYMEYCKFIEEYEQLGHCQEVVESDDDISCSGYYLPHHAIFRLSSSTTKIRVVFDASAKSSRAEKSLNDVLQVGATLQSDIFSILLRFRKHQVVFTADITKIFAKMKAIHSHSLNEIREAIECQSQIQQLLERGGFPVHKWCSNAIEVLNQIPESDREKLVHLDNSSVNVMKTLGLVWSPQQDEFVFNVNITNREENPHTKRSVLSEISRLFDPLGLISPVTIIAKIIMQRIWKAGLAWDDPLEEEVLVSWLQFRKSLFHVNSIKIPRCTITSGIKNIEFHGFSDASAAAYGAVIYTRCILSDGTIRLNMLCSKSKVSPIAEMTIPRKELLGARLLSRLLVKVLDSFQLKISDVILWSDSQVVLAWLQKPLPSLELFVQNRVMEIMKNTQGCTWNYIRSKQNPADIISRGQLPLALSTNELWWNAPKFLSKADYKLEIPDDIPDEDLPELRKVHLNVAPVVNEEKLPVFSKFSSFRKMQRVLELVLRFISNCKLKSSNERSLYHYLTIQELRSALHLIIKVIQHEALGDEIHRMMSRRPYKNISSLDPIYDNGILRVGGRLQNSRLPFDMKHPIILPKHPITDQLIRKIICQKNNQELHHMFPFEPLKFQSIDRKSAVLSSYTRSTVSENRYTSPVVNPVLTREKESPDEFLAQARGNRAVPVASVKSTSLVVQQHKIILGLGSNSATTVKLQIMECTSPLHPSTSCSESTMHCSASSIYSSSRLRYILLPVRYTSFNSAIDNHITEVVSRSQQRSNQGWPSFGQGDRSYHPNNNSS
ncbi:uncharacterized protein LOC131434092 [Malaya genurostris]|uniref:uncharacterized protein LOC131434092 n=1 Tax=Malaya genurostris TaxID=325434 RepID=UPI0026F3EEA4|nr:uncharacterized protein LOC131434092 [Malaya genurostris]